VSEVVPAQPLPLPTVGGDQIVPQPKASGDHNIHQHQQATFEVAQWFKEAIISTENPWPIISSKKYLVIDEAWKLPVEAQNHQQALAGISVYTPSLCQLPSGPSPIVDPQIQQAGSVIVFSTPQLDLW